MCRKNDTPTYEALITALIARLGADDELTELFLSEAVTRSGPRCVCG